MPKKSNSVTKSHRIESLRKILERWGRLNKQQIDQHVAAQLNLDENVISRTLYRDLEELVNNHEVRVYYFNRDGSTIDEFDPDVHKNTQCEWALVGSESQIVGQDILKANGALLLASERLGKYIKVDSGSSNVEFKTLHLFFNIPNHFLCLKIEKEMLPLTIVIGRISPKITNTQSLFNDLEKQYGKRTLMLALPYASISSFKPGSKQMGHSALTFIVNDRNPEFEDILIRDLNSKNKTYYCKLSQVEADIVRKNCIETVDKTLTEGWNHLSKSDLNIKKIEVVDSSNIQSPSLVFVSEMVPLLVI